MRQRKNGFTLVELLVVIAIIGILAGILLPVLARSRESAKRVKCVTNLDQMLKGCLNYSNDWNGTFPFVTGDACLQSLNRLYPQYIADTKQYQCPSTSDKLTGVDVKKYVPGSAPAGTDLAAGNCDYGFDNRHGPEDRSGLAGDFTGGGASANSTNHGSTSGAGNGQNMTFTFQGNQFFGDFKRKVESNDDLFFVDDSATIGLASDSWIKQ